MNGEAISRIVIVGDNPVSSTPSPSVKYDTNLFGILVEHYTAKIRPCVLETVEKGNHCGTICIFT